MPPNPLIKLRSICLALPDAYEVTAWGEPTFRHRNRMFAMHASADTHHGGGRPAVWIKTSRDNQELLISLDPERFFSPPYAGKAGWVGVWIDRRPNWKAIGELLQDAHSSAGAPAQVRRAKANKRQR